MSVRDAALVAVIAGAVAAGLVWLGGGMLANIQYALAHRGQKKSTAPEDAPVEDDDEH